MIIRSLWLKRYFALWFYLPIKIHKAIQIVSRWLMNGFTNLLFQFSFDLFPFEFRLNWITFPSQVVLINFHHKLRSLAQKLWPIAVRRCFRYWMSLLVWLGTPTFTAQHINVWFCSFFFSCLPKFIWFVDGKNVGIRNRGKFIRIIFQQANKQCSSGNAIQATNKKKNKWGRIRLVTFEFAEHTQTHTHTQSQIHAKKIQ